MDFKVGLYENVPYEEYAQIEAYRSHDLTTGPVAAYVVFGD